MKIGIFDPYLNSFSGGEKYMLSLGLSLRALGHEVYLFWDKQDEMLYKKIAQDKLGLDISSLIFTKNIFAKSVSFWSRFKESKKFDRIIILTDGSIPLVAPMLYIHCQTPMEWVKTNTIKERFKITRVQEFICNSLYTKEFIDKKFHVDSAIIYPPVISVKTSGVEKENIILHVGRFGINQTGSSYKKQDELVSMFKTMVDKGLTNWNLTLVISIDDTQKEQLMKLKQLAQNYPIIFIENPPHSEIIRLYNKACIYWHASGFGEDLSLHPDRAEHFGISTVEAMSAGAVPVVINAGGQKEIVKEGENGFLWNTLHECIEKTEEVISNKTLRDTLSKQAIATAQTFTYESFCKKVQEIIV